jgi:uncharacterized protein (DUF2236 family)
MLRHVSGERLMVLGWSRAILMQLAHPLMAAGVARHSQFRGRATEAVVRLYHTVAAMLSLVLGDDRTRRETIAHIRAIHRTVNGTLGRAAGPFSAETRYSAEDPALLQWVHITLIESTAILYQRLVGPLGSADLDALCDESAATLLDLGGDPQTAPRTWRELCADIDRMAASGEIVVTAEGRAMANALLSPHAGLVPIPFVGWHRLIAIGLLPPFIRDAYGFEWDAKREARLTRVLSVIRAARRVSPSLLARWRQTRREPTPVVYGTSRRLRTTEFLDRSAPSIGTRSRRS